MSVCAHVSKVSKDYSPYGFSIMESAAVDVSTVKSVGAGGGPLAMMDDAAAWLEKVVIASPTGYPASDSSGNLWTVQLTAYDKAGAATVLASWSSYADGAAVGLAANVPQELQIPLNEVPAGCSLVVNVGLAGTPTADLSASVFVRYRRKA